jgi:hypothetical protein
MSQALRIDQVDEVAAAGAKPRQANITPAAVTFLHTVRTLPYLPSLLAHSLRTRIRPGETIRSWPASPSPKECTALSSKPASAAVEMRSKPLINTMPAGSGPRSGKSRSAVMRTRSS